MLIKDFQSILWEYDLEKLNFSDDIVFIRSLKFWDRNHIKFLKKELWLKKFKENFLKNINQLDKKTINYWAIIFDLDVKKYLNNLQNTYEKLNKPVFTRSFN